MAIPFERLGWLFARWGERVYPGWARPLLAEWLRSLPPGAQVLDLGGGTGVLSSWALAERPELEYVVVDRAAGMLAHAPGPVRTLVADAHELPLQNASVDGVMLGEALHHFAHSERALAEVARVLRPGGGLWVYDFDPAAGIGRWVYWGERLAGEPANFYRPQDLAAELENLGFGHPRTDSRRGRYVLRATRSV